ncbi:MAG: MFS transporter [Kiritimatiellia bacterium]
MSEENRDGNYKWVALALLTVGYFMQQGTRQIFNSVLPQMKSEFTSVAAGDWGTVMTVFAAVYGVCVMFAGVLGDLFSRKKTILISVAMFSCAILASGFARPLGWLSLVSYLVAVYSVVFAAGQCLYPSSANSILSQLHDKTRSMAMSIMQSALYAAVVAVSLASGWLAGLGKGAWRYPFWAFGGLGVLLFVVLLVWLRDTKPLPPAPGAVAKPSMSEAFKAFAVKPSAWLLMAAFGFQVFTNFGFTVWTPVYLRETYFANTRMAATEVGFWTMFHSVIWHYLGCVIGILFASRVSDRLAANWKPARMATNVAGLLAGAPCIFLAYHSNSLELCAAGLFLFGLAHGVYDSNMFASLYDVIKPRYRASSTGFMCCGAFLVGAVAPKLIGVMMDRGVSVKDCLTSLSGAYFAGAAVILFTIAFCLKKDYEG